MIAIMSVIKPCTCSYTRILPFWYPEFARTFTHSANLDVGPKSGSNNKCRARVGFELQNETYFTTLSWR